MAGKSINTPARKQLATAIAVSSGLVASTLATAGTYTATLSGAIVSESSTVFGVPGVPSTPNPPFYQQPRLVPFGGPGWATTLSISIDSNSGEVTKFKEELTAGVIWGSGGTVTHLHTKGAYWASGANFPMPQCGVTSANPGETGTIVYSCPIGPSTYNQKDFTEHVSPGYYCITYQPYTTFTEGPGCGNHNSGVTFPGGIPDFGTPEEPNGTYIAVAANSGVALASHPALHATNDPEQIFNGVDVHSYLSRSTGGDFTIRHTGTFAAGNFMVTGVEFYNRVNATFAVGDGSLPPGIFTEFKQSQYNTVTSQTYAASESDLGKPVPAMGAFGVTALLVSLTGLAGRLIARK